ncbi:MAG: choice-of-anchor J domain-containing protein [Bacteroidales bacterium]
MKKYVLISMVLFFLCFCSSKLQAQSPLFSEDFEGNTFPPAGWETIQDHSDSVYLHWYQFIDTKGTLQGMKAAYIDTKVYQTPTDYPEHPKKEWLITPSIALPSDQSCQLSFLWQAQKEALDPRTYNTWLLISTNEGAIWDTLWSLVHEVAMVNSGVPFPWANFQHYKSEIDLTKYKGKQVKIAWYYHNFERGKGNMFKLDMVQLKKYTPILNPVPQLNPLTYTFPQSYMGVTVSSGEAFTLTNVGIDTLRITSLEGLNGTDFKCMLDTSAVSLLKNEFVKFAVYYTPSEAGAKSATLKINTNGGSVELVLSGTKIALPANYTLESFENDGFPPIGWTTTDGWSKSMYAASSGYYGAYINFAAKGVLQTPRLDLSTGSHYIGFDFIDYADDEQFGSVCDNVNEVQFSSDGGKSWSTIYTTTPSAETVWQRMKINLASKSDSCYVRFLFTLNGEISFDVLTSTWYVDNVVLPPLYGANAVPNSANHPKPADKAKDQYINNLILSWDPVLHATSYEVKVGTTASNLGNVLNTTVLSSQVSVSGLNFNSTYYWQVTPKNNAGKAKNPEVWSFVTMLDPTIKTFPYTSGFEEATFPANGWRTFATASERAQWERSNIFPYEGKYSAYSGAFEGTSVLAMPPVVLPSTPEMQMAFMWGNSAPSGLLTTDNPNLLPPLSKVAGADTIFFEISEDEATWKTLGFLSEANHDTMYWRRAKFVLNEYAGKKVYMRWRYSCSNYAKSTGSALDNVHLGEYSANGKILYNYSEWNAGVVNSKISVDSKNLYLTNDGAANLKIKSVTFNSSNFSSNLQVGSNLAPGVNMPFKITFTAITPGIFTDSMTVECENGLSSKFPVRGQALNTKSRCFTFDYDEPFSLTNIHNFTTVDVDGLATVEPVLIYYPHRGAPFSFIVMNVKEADWRNVYPVSGDQCLYACSPATSASSAAVAEDWLISDPMMATSTSKMRFYAKSYGNAEDFSLHKISVLVSETGNNISSFKVLKGYDKIDLPHISTGEFTEFKVDLSSYNGKKIYVALRHTVDQNGLVMFLDDIWFENFEFSAIDNQAPRFTTTSVSTLPIAQEYNYEFKAVDPDGDSMSFSTVGLPSWLNITYNGVDGGHIKGMAPVKGNVYFVIKVTDGVLENTQEVLFNVVGEKDSTANELNKEVLFECYPNPVKDVIHINTTAEHYEVSLISTSGTILYSKKNEKDISTTLLPKGVYILQLKTSTSIYSQRIIKY